MKTARGNWKFPSVTLIIKYHCVLQFSFISVFEVQAHVFCTVHDFVWKLLISVSLILLIYVMPCLSFTHCSITRVIIRAFICHPFRAVSHINRCF
jgi:hypothetical protein